MLCDKLYLERISSNSYLPHLQKLAQQRWQSKLDELTFNQIIKHTELHTFYVNMLCNLLWAEDKLPDVDDVNAAWEACFNLEKRRLVAELEKLTKNQQDVLKSLALNPLPVPTSQKFLSLVGKSYSSVRLVLKSLVEKDMIYTITQEDLRLPTIKIGHIRVLDPLLAYALRKYS
jgi:hypothetical protein